MTRTWSTLICLLATARSADGRAVFATAGSRWRSFPLKTTPDRPARRAANRLVVEWPGNGQFLARERARNAFPPAIRPSYAISNRTLLPVSDGSAIVTATTGELTATSKVAVPQHRTAIDTNVSQRMPSNSRRRKLQFRRLSRSGAGTRTVSSFPFRRLSTRRRLAGNHP